MEVDKHAQIEANSKETIDFINMEKETIMKQESLDQDSVETWHNVYDSAFEEIKHEIYETSTEMEYFNVNIEKYESTRIKASLSTNNAARHDSSWATKSAKEVSVEPDNKSEPCRVRSSPQNVSTRNSKVFSCGICGHKTLYKNDIVRHMTAHTGEKPYSCKYCNYKCFNSRNLMNHMRDHSREKTYCCELCSYKCRTASNLKAHLRTHTGDKPHACNICDYKCSLSSYLKIHMRIHTGEQPYACNICDYRCSTTNKLKRHLSTHT